MQLNNYVPRDFGIRLTVPIPKGDVSRLAGSTSDYRGITASAVISKIFEHCLLKKYAKYLYRKTCQFGFKKKIRTNHVIYTIRRTID